MNPDRDNLHFEPYIHLAGLTHDSALIAWGGFFFRRGARGGTVEPDEDTGSQWMVVDDQRLDAIQPGRTDSIGERSEPYGEAEVEVRDANGHVVARTTVSRVNHAWIRDLTPETEYSYRIRVDGRPWAEGTLHDWTADADGRMELRPAGGRYDNRFRTHPDLGDARPLNFAVLGDFGVGIRTQEAAARRQRELAGALERAVDRYGARLVVTTGDNVYATGDEDDDWFFTFYQPYRYLLNRIPFYPTVGNHDVSDTPNSDDRAQLADNFYLKQRFEDETEAKRASADPGLFYVFGYGSDVEFICIDTTRDGEDQARYFEHPNPRRFLEAALPPADGAGHIPWRIPFSHHPTFCAGPHHDNTEGMARVLAPLFERAGVRLVLAGHEHNFQYSQAGGIHYIVSGAGGELREEAPSRFEAGRTRAWAAAGHFLIVELADDKALIHPLAAADGGARPVELRAPDGEAFPTPIVVPR